MLGFIDSLGASEALFMLPVINLLAAMVVLFKPTRTFLYSCYLGPLSSFPYHPKPLPMFITAREVGMDYTPWQLS